MEVSERKLLSWITQVTDMKWALFTSAYANYWVELSLVHRSDDSPATETDLKEQVQAIVSIREQKVTKVTLLPPGESGPGVTYASDISSLEMLETHSEEEKLALDLIGTKCNGVRTCSTIGQKGPWEALSFAYVEHLCTFPKELQGLIKNIQKYPSAKALLVELLLSNDRKRWLEAQVARSESWLEVAQCLKEMAFGGLSVDGTVPVTQLNEFLRHHLDASLEVLASALNVQITLLTTTQMPSKIVYVPAPSKDIPVQIHLIKQWNMYHIGYNSLTDDIPIDKNAVRDRLTKVKNMGKASLTSDLDYFKRVIPRNAEFIQKAEQLLHILTTKLPSKFFTSDLIAHSELLLQDYTIVVNKLRPIGTYELSPNVKDMMERSQFSAVFASSIFHITKVCAICVSKSSQCILDCTHSFCRGCIVNYSTQMKAKYRFILMSNGDTIPEFRCPSCACTAYFPAEKLRTIIGEEAFHQALQKTMEATHRKMCTRCSKYRLISEFQNAVECGCQVCEHCWCDLYRRNHKTCICGKRMGFEIIQHLESLTAVCAGCNLKKSLLYAYSQVECSDHILCRVCSEHIAKGTERCFACFRLFSQQELQVALGGVERYCEICGKECRETQLDTQCGCVICLNCAKTKASLRRQCTLCFTCNSVLPKQSWYCLFAHLSHPVPEPLVCTMCNEAISDREVQLRCFHTFHKRCLEAYLSAAIQRNSSAETVTCPAHSCSYEIPYSETAKYVSTAIYSIYLTQILEGHSRICPKCGHKLKDISPSGEKLQSIICTQCGFHFCGGCFEPYDVRHAEKGCKSAEIRYEIRRAQEKGGATVCPVCKKVNITQRGEIDLVKMCIRCGLRFCVECSVLEILFLVHGVAWHRPSCSQYNSTLGSQMSLNCRKCIIKGTLCTPPTDHELQ